MSARTIYPVILSGGSGTRLWPLARTSLPKQLLALNGPKTLMQETALRASLPNAARPVVICGEKHRFLVAEQMRSVGVSPRAIVVEPEGRNTAPAAAIAALLVQETDLEGVVLLMPSDHVVEDRGAFEGAIAKAIDVAQRGYIATLGMKAKTPETGYGYIQKGDPIAIDGAYSVQRFTEKPDSETAAQFVATGEYFWNSGIFVFRADVMIAELKKYAPAVVDACIAALAKGARDPDLVRLDRGAFEKAQNVSVDFAVMERTAKAAVIPCEMGWSDVGSWDAVWALEPHDANGNAINGDVFLQDTSGSLVHSDNQLVALVGVRDIAVVTTGDVVLVVNRHRAQEVRILVDTLRAARRSEVEEHVKVDRPWGSYQSIATGGGYQVKRITVNPGGRLSLQMHHRRAEHWVVVEGAARVTRDDEIVTMGPNESIFIPLGAKHRLENPGDIPLQLIEVQCGDYLGEDDIVRFDDAYGRADQPKADHKT